MRVIAASNPVPRMPEPLSNKPLEHIQPAPAEPVEVPDNSYYQRRVASGELKIVNSRAKSTAKGGE